MIGAMAGMGNTVGGARPEPPPLNAPEDFDAAVALAQAALGRGRFGKSRLAAHAHVMSRGHGISKAQAARKAKRLKKHQMRGTHGFKKQ